MTLPPRPWTFKHGEKGDFAIYDSEGNTFLYFPYSPENEEMMIAIVEFINAV